MRGCRILVGAFNSSSLDFIKLRCSIVAASVAGRKHFGVSAALLRPEGRF